MKQKILQILTNKQKEEGTDLYFTSKRLSEEAKISLHIIKKELRQLRKDGKIIYTHVYDDTNYCNCINENCNHCECGEDKPFERSAWYWVFKKLI